MAQYRSHTEATLGYMDAFWLEFHRIKDVFLEFRASKQTVAESTQAVRQLRHDQQQEATSQQLTPSKRW